MANGTYGTRRPANITPDDVEIFYYYRPSRSSDSPDFASFKRLDSSSCLMPSNVEIEGESETIELAGMYDLRLPMDKFGQKGIYTIYIKPKEIKTKIIDVSTLSAYPDIRGIVISDSGLTVNNGDLTGYRVEYLGEDNKRTGEYRIITSNNKCEPVAQNYSSSTQKGIRYVFNDASNLIFCTLTPSTSMSYNSNSLPNIGKTNQEILLINTKFNPEMIEIEMVDHDIETVSTMLEGKQLRNLNKGIITTFNEDGNIYHQAIYGNITNQSKGINHDFKIPNTDNIDVDEEAKMDEIEKNI